MKDKIINKIHNLFKNSDFNDYKWKTSSYELRYGISEELQIGTKIYAQEIPSFFKCNYYICDANDDVLLSGKDAKEVFFIIRNYMEERYKEKEENDKIYRRESLNNFLNGK